MFYIMFFLYNILYFWLCHTTLICLHQSRELKLNKTFAFDAKLWLIAVNLWQCLSKTMSVIHISCTFSMDVLVVSYSLFYFWLLLVLKFSKYNLIILRIMFQFDWVNWGFCIMWFLKWAFILRSIACQQPLINLKCVKQRNKEWKINYWSILFICLARAYLKHSRSFRMRTFFIHRLFQTHSDRGGCCAFDKTRLHIISHSVN